MDRNLLQSGWRTLAYAAVFGQGLRYGDLEKYFLGAKNPTSAQLQQLWQYWKVQGLIHIQKKRFPRKLWNEVVAFQRFISFFPWVQSVWLTGSLAVGTATEADDIDFLIITDSERLWLTRALVLFGGSILRKVRTRRMNNEKARGLWCLNMWLESEALSLDVTAQSLYTAREVVQAVPIYVREGVAGEEFIRKNGWARAYCERGWRHAHARARFLPHSFPLFRFPLWFNPVLSFFNRLSWQWQKRRIEQHQTREVVQFDRAFFHPRDTQTMVRQEYERICTLLQVTPYEKTTRPNA